MKILIAGSVQGDQGYEVELLAKALDEELKGSGHLADYFLLPYTRDMLSLPEQIFNYQAIDTSAADLLITIGYPACMLVHPNKVIYLLETAPMLYEYKDTEYGVLMDPQYSQIFYALRHVEYKTFHSAKRVICGSRLLAKDIWENHGVKAAAMYYPSFPFSEKEEAPRGNYLVSESSLLPYHRPELLVGFAKNNPEFVLHLYVPETKPVYMETMDKWIRGYGIGSKLQVTEGRPSDQVLKGAVAYIDTDYLARNPQIGAIRALRLGTQLITFDDSGAILEMMENKGTYNKAGQGPKLAMGNARLGKIKAGDAFQANIHKFAKDMVGLCE